MMELTMILDTQSVHLASEVNKMAAESGMLNGAAALGKGVGAIMLLFVVFYYASAILDGGKFQLKMLWPLVIFICAANFSIISKPVLSFTGAISGGITSSASSGGTSISEMAAKTSSKARSESSAVRLKEGLGEAIGNYKPIDLSTYSLLTGLPTSDGVFVTSAEEEVDSKGKYRTKINYSDGTEAYMTSNNSLKVTKGEKAGLDAASEDPGWLSGVFSGFGQALERFWQKYVVADWNHLWADIISAISGEQLNADEIDGNLFILIVTAILKFFVNVFALVMTAFGSIMTTIFIAFGPLIWGFAVFPGMGKNIGSWLIRLCQFALYGPVTIFIKNLSLSLLAIWGADTYTMETGMSFIGNCAAFGCAIFMLANVPSICSMIIEGAQGSASLSGGYHAMQGALSTALTGGVVGQAVERFRNLGEKGRDKDQLNVLNDINKSINNLNRPDPNDYHIQGNANTQSER